MRLLPVDTAVTVFVNATALIDDTDFKTREESVVYNQAGLDLVWNFETPAGVITQTAVTPTDTAGVYDWTNVGNGMYKIEIPASGGGTINNDTEGYGFFSGFATGILPWTGPTYAFVPAHVVNGLVAGSDNLQVDAVQVSGSATAADNAESCFTGTITTLDALDTAQDSQHAQTQSDIAGLNDPTAAAIADAVWDEDATGHQTGGTFGQAIGDPGANTETIYDAVVTDAAGTNVAADIIAIKAVADDVLTDTAEIGAAGAGLTAINLPDQTMNIIGNITGNLSGSVGSVTGNVGGNVTGSVGSLATQAKADVNAEVDTALSDYDPPTRAELTSDTNSILSKLLKYFQLLLRSDAAIATDNATELTAINADGGSGAGDYDNTTDSVEALQAEHVQTQSDIAGLNDPTAASIADAVWDEDATAHQTGGTFGQAIGDPGANTETIYDAVITDAAGTNIAADIITVDTVVDNMNSGIITGAAATGTLSTTQATTNLTGYANDQLIGRIITWLSGNCEGEQTDITDYASSSGLLTFTALTTAPANTDTFKIT